MANAGLEVTQYRSRDVSVTGSEAAGLTGQDAGARVSRAKDVQSPAFYEAVDVIEAELEKCTKLTEKELLHLHKEYNARFLSDNQRIWMTAQIMVPTSLVPLVGLASAKQSPSLGIVLCSAAASMALVVFWHAIAENHKGYQQKNLAWVEAIERRLGIDTRKLPSQIPDAGSPFVGSVDILPKIRRMVVPAWALLWLVVAFLYGTDRAVAPVAAPAVAAAVTAGPSAGGPSTGAVAALPGPVACY